MAESIAVIFTEALWESVKTTLDSVAQPCLYEPDRWYYPDGRDCTLILYPYETLLDEYEDADLDELFKYIKEFPTSILCLELLRSRQNQACDDAARLVKQLLRQFQGVADDNYSHCWTLKEIETQTTKDGRAFLDVYRH